MSALLLQVAKLLPFLHPKVANPAMTAALTTIVLWVFTLTGHSAAPELAGAIVTVVSLGIGYLTPATSSPVITTPTASGGSVTTAP